MDQEKTTLEAEKTLLENNQPEATILEAEKTVLEKPTAEKPAVISSFMGKKVLKEFPAEGGEADLFLLEGNVLLKLYRKGVHPKPEVVEKIKKLGEQLPDNIVRILEYGIDPQTSRFYELQEYLPLGNIKNFLEGKKIDKKFLKEIIKEINEDLHALHSLNVIHRDIKPSNILVKSEKPLNLVLTDFGISSLLSEEFSKKITTVKGTPVYSAPESFTGIMGKEADYWSFGMVLLDLIDKNPFKGLSPKTIMFKITSESVPIDNEIDEELKTLLKGLLTQNRKKRWGYEEVKKWLEGKTPAVYFEEKKSGSYIFRGQSYNSLKELAKAMQESPEAFRFAVSFVQRGNLEHSGKGRRPRSCTC